MGYKDTEYIENKEQHKNGAYGIQVGPGFRVSPILSEHVRVRFVVYYKSDFILIERDWFLVIDTPKGVIVLIIIFLLFNFSNFSFSSI